MTDGILTKTKCLVSWEHKLGWNSGFLAFGLITPSQDSSIELRAEVKPWLPEFKTRRITEGQNHTGSAWWGMKAEAIPVRFLPGTWKYEACGMKHCCCCSVVVDSRLSSLCKRRHSDRSWEKVTEFLVSLFSIQKKDSRYFNSIHTRDTESKQASSVTGDHTTETPAYRADYTLWNMKALNFLHTQSLVHGLLITIQKASEAP